MILAADAGTNADYTTPTMKNYKSSEELKNRLQTFELKNKTGLNGAVLLIHPGTSEERSDKFDLKLDKLIKHYSAKGYSYKTLNELD